MDYIHHYSVWLQHSHKGSEEYVPATLAASSGTCLHFHWICLDAVARLLGSMQL